MTLHAEAFVGPIAIVLISLMSTVAMLWKAAQDQRHALEFQELQRLVDAAADRAYRDANNVNTKMARLTEAYAAHDGTPGPRAQVRCAYCGRYGALGQCPGCGAPNQPTSMPSPRRVPDVPLNRVVR